MFFFICPYSLINVTETPKDTFIKTKNRLCRAHEKLFSRSRVTVSGCMTSSDILQRSNVRDEKIH